MALHIPEAVTMNQDVATGGLDRRELHLAVHLGAHPEGHEEQAVGQSNRRRDDERARSVPP